MKLINNILIKYNTTTFASRFVVAKKLLQPIIIIILEKKM